MGVLQLSYELCLGLEPAHEIWPVDKLGPDHLDRYLPAHRGLVGPVDDSEVALPHPLPQLIPAHCPDRAGTDERRRQSVGDQWSDLPRQIQRSVLIQDALL